MLLSDTWRPECSSPSISDKNVSSRGVETDGGQWRTGLAGRKSSLNIFRHRGRPCVAVVVMVEDWWFCKREDVAVVCAQLVGARAWIRSDCAYPVPVGSRLVDRHRLKEADVIRLAIKSTVLHRLGHPFPSPFRMNRWKKSWNTRPRMTSPTRPVIGVTAGSEMSTLRRSGDGFYSFRRHHHLVRPRPIQSSLSILVQLFNSFSTN